MLKILGRFGPPGVIALYILNWILKLYYILHPEINKVTFNNTEKGLLQFPLFTKYAIAHPVMYVIVSIHVVFLLAMLINYLWVQEKLTSSSSLLPALSIVVISSLITPAFLLTVHTIIALLIVLALVQVFGAQVGKDAIRKIFFAGFLLGIVVMIKSVYLLIAIGMIGIIAIIRAINIRAILAYIIGFTIPMYIFITTIWLAAPNVIKKISWFAVDYPTKIVRLEAMCLSLVILVWLMVHAYFLKQNKNEIGGIQTQKKWLSLRLLWVVLFICSVLSNVLPSSAFFVLFIFTALLVSQCFNEIINKKWANISLVLLVITIFINQWVFA